MDRAFEGILNVGFYFVLVCFVLYFLDVDPFVLFASISGFVLGFAFMVSCVDCVLCNCNLSFPSHRTSLCNSCNTIRSALPARNILKGFFSS